MWLLLGVTLAVTTLTVAAPPDEVAQAAGHTEETLSYSPDHGARMTVPVSIGDRGPYGFVVDTGSERTVISRELAGELGLGAGPTATVHTMTEVSQVPTFRIPGLAFGSIVMKDIHAPAFSRRNIGAEGLLGVDSLQTQRVTFDFGRQEMTLSPSQKREERWPDDAIVIVGKSRLGRLMLLDASVEGERVWAVLDTGSQVTVGNAVLRNRLARREKLPPTVPVNLTSVTGGSIVAEYSVARTLRLGGLEFHNLPIAFAEVHPFRQLNLTDRPAVLIGMDALQLLERVSVDFANRRVRLLRPDSDPRDEADAG